jgi:hypothetical protein
MKKPSLKDSRRNEYRETLYRAIERRDQLLDRLARTHTHIKRLKRMLARIDRVDPRVVSKQPVSVAEGKLLDPDTLALVQRMAREARELDDDISDVGGKS